MLLFTLSTLLLGVVLMWLGRAEAAPTASAGPCPSLAGHGGHYASLLLAADNDHAQVEQWIRDAGRRQPHASREQLVEHLALRMRLRQAG